jgi:hypothetical protein
MTQLRLKRISTRTTLRVKRQRLRQCFQGSIPQNVVGGSARNRGINIKNVFEYCEKFQICLEISREFLSANWQYWSNLHVLPTEFLFYRL